MKASTTVAALIAAALLVSAVSLVSPAAAHLLDPLLLVVVYAGLTRGEVHGMLAGAAAGWLEDVLFGPAVLGLRPLARLVIGWGVGVAGARLLLVGPGPRLLVLVVASLADARLFEWLSAAFGVDAALVSTRLLLARAAITAVVGAVAFELADRRRRRAER